MAKRNNSKPYINGHQVRATHSATIGSVLADHSDVPPVSSKGSSFYNADSWTLRVLCQQMCQWASVRTKVAYLLRKSFSEWVRLLQIRRLAL